MGLVEGNHASELFARPGKDLVEARVFGPARAQCRIGDEQNAFGQRYGSPELPAREGLDIERQSAKCFPVAACIFLAQAIRAALDALQRAAGAVPHALLRNGAPLVLLGALAAQRNLVWHSNEALYGGGPHSNPRSPKCHFNAGFVAGQQERRDEQLAHVRAEATRPRQHAFEAEAQLAAARAAAELCADDDDDAPECARREVEADDAARDADGPLIV